VCFCLRGCGAVKSDVRLSSDQEDGEQQQQQQGFTVAREQSHRSCMDAPSTRHNVYLPIIMLAVVDSPMDSFLYCGHHITPVVCMYCRVLPCCNGRRC
jgi:hypothetical protein